GDNAAGRKLTGRFLHITDIHPDPFYKLYSSTDKDHACHRSKGPAGVYGAESTDCDSPVSLVNETFKWIKENLKNEVDFVIWTGDSARHDNDELIPRTRNQIVAQNELLVEKFFEVWGKPDNYEDDDPTNDFTIPIVPTLGNNDVLPHNIFLEGPNTWTRKYLDIWRQFVPEEQRHQFQRGGWYYVEVIPNKLAVISLNTLYFYTKNAAVDGCAPKSEPGYEHMDWLRIQLDIFRQRGMKVMLMGHVPPARTESKISWDEACWQKYTLWMEQYRDIIVGSFYGHMNIDHFIVQDFKDVKKSTRNGAIKAMAVEEDDFTVDSDRSYLIELRDLWLEIIGLSDADDVSKSNSKKNKKYLDHIGGKYGERYAVSHVNPSIVPNYFPTIRVYQYNITGVQDTVFPHPGRPVEAQGNSAPQLPLTLDDEQTLDEYLFALEKAQETVSTTGAKADKKKGKAGKKHKFHLPTPPSTTTPPGPAYSAQMFSLLGYTQYYANLTHINNDFRLFDIGRGAFGQWMERKDAVDERVEIEKDGKKPKSKPKKFKFEVEYETRGGKTYKMDDLLVRSYITLAERIGERKDNSFSEKDVDFLKDVNDVVNEGVDTEKKKKKHKKKGKKGKINKVWFEFVRRAFVGSMDPQEIEE
ncbi:Endopolyphosphatase, partial [Rhizodiscina lignyota]